VSVLVVDKPSGPTSFAVVKRVRRALGVRRKVGHGGTLDPMASGVLPICLGEGTKLAAFLLDADKEYEAAVRFGVETDTLDAEGTVLATRPVTLTRDDVETALEAFRGAIEQVPPMYSALKRQGRPLHAYARAGETVARAARRVTVHELLLTGYADGVAHLRVRCSKGTYVRALAADLGRALGPGAHLSALRRLASGPFRLAMALTLDELEARVASGEPLPFVSLADALAHLPALAVDDATALALRRGQRVGWPEAMPAAPYDGRVRVLDGQGALVAVASPEEGAFRTWRVFSAPSSTDTHAR
jgi:tRNA pseudouridine55 synthase